MIGVIYHDIFLRHLENYSHPERPERLKAIMERLKKGDLADRITIVQAKPALREWIERIHDIDYVDQILSLRIDRDMVLDWGDTVATPKTPEAALYAAGAGVQGVQLVMDREFPSVFCAVRPPGHHAGSSQAMGFCIFNNIAIAAAHLLDQYRLTRVAIVDFDVHHGNGTESAFLEDNRVLYISVHQYPHYPGTGSRDDIGSGKGKGYTVNIPLPPGSGDDEFIDAFNRIVCPRLDDYKPEFILISAGFDGHRADYLASCNLSASGYGEMSRLIKAAADKHCAGRIVSFLEGGYDLQALADSVEEHLKALL